MHLEPRDDDDRNGHRQHSRCREQAGEVLEVDNALQIDA